MGHNSKRKLNDNNNKSNESSGKGKKLKRRVNDDAQLEETTNHPSQPLPQQTERVEQNRVSDELKDYCNVNNNKASLSEESSYNSRLTMSSKDSLNEKMIKLRKDLNSMDLDRGRLNEKVIKLREDLNPNDIE